MFTENEYSIFDFAAAISEALDLVSADLNDHHKRVAYIAYTISKGMKLPDDEISDIVLAATLHDIGAFTNKERLEIALARFKDNEQDNHQIKGYKLLRNFKPFSNAAVLIKYHHADFDKAAENVPLGSHIIHLADTIAVLLDKRREVLTQVAEIISRIEEKQAIFHPDTLAAFRQSAKIECFWIEACVLPSNVVLPERIQFPRQIIDLETFRNLAKLISQIIDFRSRSTATHSSGVAAVALEIARIYKFSERGCRAVEIAAYMHDIGKLAISNEVLEKNIVLDYEEYHEMRKHAYYTYAVLSKIKGFEQVAMWAAYHHERLDGNGYPFHVKGENLNQLARIIAVADIVTAIMEDKSYRLGMNDAKAIEILSGMVENGGIDKEVVEIVRENFSRINDVRIKAQQEAQQEYNAFYATAPAADS